MPSASALRPRSPYPSPVVVASRAAKCSRSSSGSASSRAPLSRSPLFAHPVQRCLFLSFARFEQCPFSAQDRQSLDVETPLSPNLVFDPAPAELVPAPPVVWPPCAVTCCAPFTLPLSFCAPAGPPPPSLAEVTCLLATCTSAKLQTKARNVLILRDYEMTVH
jgi:hypothetical protein